MQYNGIETKQPADDRGHIFTARWVVPISNPPLERGAVVIAAEKIIAVDTLERIKQNYDYPVIDLENAIIFPGLVNGHTHIEHNNAAQKLANFIEYYQALYIDVQQTSTTQKKEIVKSNIAELRACGTIALADFSATGISGEPLIDSPFFARVFHEVIGFKKAKAAHILKYHRDRIRQFPVEKTVTKHLAPSSLWTVSPDLLREISVNELHTALHFGMTSAEKDFFLNGKGPLKQFLLAVGDYDYSWETPRTTPLHYYLDNHFYTRHNIFVHGIDLNAEDLDTINRFHTKINICLCPRSADLLSLKQAPTELFQSKGINICLGTESKLIVPDLDLRKEIRHCVDQLKVTPEEALKFATLNGAYAIGFHKEVGSLEPGKTAEILVLQTDAAETTDPYEAIVTSQGQLKWLTGFAE